jgi:crotonobetainyl-CoA:carnitine CoA-transferase CaiB-like acyl-CoA transferase
VNQSLSSEQSFLSPYRVLDLTDEKGYMCGKILGGLGAAVIKVEPPGGDRARTSGPFFHDLPHPEKSLFWYAFNVNKRGITLNLETPKGKEIFQRLASTADFIIESFPPGYLDHLGLGYSTLRQIHPKIILTSISPFGQSGPRRDFKGSDLICWASSGYMALCGEPNRPPLQVSLPQAYLHGGAEAALGSMVAFWARQITGVGQQVDVSIQESLAWECLNAFANWDMNGVILKREGAYRVFGPYRIRYVYPCKDGHVIFLLLGGHIGARGQRALCEWMNREGMSDDFLNHFNWDTFDASSYDDVLARQLEPRFEKFFLTKNKEELYAGARRMQYLLAPMNTVEDVLHDPQLKARDFWVKVDHPEWGTVLTYPGPPFQSNVFSWKQYRRAPLIGEHNEEIYGGELGFSRKEIRSLRSSGVI